MIFCVECYLNGFCGSEGAILKLISLSLQLSRSLIKAKHKKYILFATLILCLEYLDLIIYIKNTKILTDEFLIKSISRIEGICLLFFILLLSNFLAKPCAAKFLTIAQQKFTNSSLVIVSSLIISLAFICQALLLLFYCKTLIIWLLIGFFAARFIYQFALAIVIHDTYEFLLNAPELADDFIYLILNSLELSVFCGMFGYKLLSLLNFSTTATIAVFILIVSGLWLVSSVLFFLHRQELNQFNSQHTRCAAANNFAMMLESNLQDTIIAFSIVGIRSSLCIIGVIYMPTYLIESLHFAPAIANNIILSSSFLALSLCILIEKYLYQFNYIDVLKFGLVGLIIGCLISYLLFFFKVIPFIGVAILVVFHSLFALGCPLILNQLFAPELRQLAVISCYRNSFLIFASFSFILITLLGGLFHSYILAPAVLLITITVICYSCLILFNKRATVTQ